MSRRWHIDAAGVRDLAVITLDVIGQLVGAALVTIAFHLVGDQDPIEDLGDLAETP